MRAALLAATAVLSLWASTQAFAQAIPLPPIGQMSLTRIAPANAEGETVFLETTTLTPRSAGWGFLVYPSDRTMGSGQFSGMWIRVATDCAANTAAIRVIVGARPDGSETFPSANDEPLQPVSGNSIFGMVARAVCQQATPVGPTAADKSAAVRIAREAVAFDLGGPVVWMRDVAAEGVYVGTLTRRGDTSVYDAVWVFAPTGQIITDVLEVRGVVNGQLIIHRQGINGTYTAPVVNGQLGRGRASWVSDPNYYWEILRR